MVPRKVPLCKTYHNPVPVIYFLPIIGLLMIFTLLPSFVAFAIVTDLPPVDSIHDPQAVHANQEAFYNFVVAKQRKEAFELAFEEGDVLFDTDFNALDGGGANVGQGQRFTRVPRADLDGLGEWADHVPPRPTGPNAQSCTSCHDTPFEDGAGKASSNVIRDPQRTGRLTSFINRNTPHLFAVGALQRLAEEMTEDLHRIRDNAIKNACSSGKTQKANLMTKGGYCLERSRSRGRAVLADLTSIRRRCRAWMRI